MVADGLDYAFLGISKTQDGFVAVYSVEAIIAELMTEDLMDFETAEEYVQFNILDAYVGKQAPIFVDIVPDDLWQNFDN